MLEEMGNPGFSEGIVGAADFVPDHLYHRRDAMVRHDHDLHAIVEREALRAEALRRRRRCSSQSQHEKEEEDQGFAPLRRVAGEREGPAPQGEVDFGRLRRCGATPLTLPSPPASGWRGFSAAIAQYTPLSGVVSRFSTGAGAAPVLW